MFEPEYDGSTDVSTRWKGPLALALHERQQAETCCNAPLVMDFLSRRFTCGPPNLTDGVLKDQDELSDLRGGTEAENDSPVLDRVPLLEGLARGGNENRHPHLSGSMLP